MLNRATINLLPHLGYLLLKHLQLLIFLFPDQILLILLHHRFLLFFFQDQRWQTSDTAALTRFTSSAHHPQRLLLYCHRLCLLDCLKIVKLSLGGSLFKLQNPSQPPTFILLVDQLRLCLFNLSLQVEGIFEVLALQVGSLALLDLNSLIQIV